MSRPRPSRSGWPGVLALALLAACGSPSEPAPAELVDLPRPLTSSEERVVARSNAFGLELARQVVARDDRPNVVVSPFSASMALGMTLNGAGGGTFDAMRSTLGFEGLSQEEINAAYRGLLDVLGDLDPAVRFDVANAIWANREVAFHPAFFDAVAQAFDATAEARDFRDPATLADINGWVRSNTGGLIDSILDALDPDLAMLLVNAIYFEGSWTTRFDPADTRRQAFTREDGTTVQVDMMHLDGVELPMGGGDGYAAVELPYGGRAYSMVVLVPWGDGTARDLIAGLDADAWDAVLDGLAPREVDLLALPKFELEWDGWLNDALKAMGMDVAFDGRADFSRMSDAALCIDFVRQKTFIEVDEEGTRAAAVTAVGVRPTSFNGVVADRPFVFAIRERLSGTILFTGVVGDPTAAPEEADPVVSTC